MKTPRCYQISNVSNKLQYEQNNIHLDIARVGNDQSIVTGTLIS